MAGKPKIKAKFPHPPHPKGIPYGMGPHKGRVKEKIRIAGSAQMQGARKRPRRRIIYDTPHK